MKTTELLDKFMINGTKKGGKWTKYVFIIGIIGILLILLSTFIPKNETPTSNEITQIDTETYTKNLEEKIQTLVSKIDGVGNVDVMITLENGVEYVYANSEKKSTDNTQDYTSGSPSKSTDKNSAEQDVVMVDGNDGKQALVVTEKEPTVKGVVVVCDGGDNLKVVQNITDAVTTALNITSNRVSVVKSSAN